MKKANFIGAPAYFNLNHACRALTEAFGYHCYLVGSAMERRDFRDVDVRCILPDEEYARLFPGLKGNPSVSALWTLMSASISEWLSSLTGLPVDFQIQMRTEANEEFPSPQHPRSARSTRPAQASAATLVVASSLNLARFSSARAEGAGSFSFVRL